MELLFSNDWMQILKDEKNYFIQYNSGDHINSIRKVTVSKAEAEAAQHSEKDAESIIIKYQNIEMGLK